MSSIKDTFPDYTHVYAHVGAYQFNSANSEYIYTALIEELISGQLSQLKCSDSSITFRYKSMATDSVLSSGDYLIVLPDKSLTVSTSDTFLSTFYLSPEEPEEQNAPKVGRAKVNHAVLTS